MHQRENQSDVIIGTRNIVAGQSQLKNWMHIISDLWQSLDLFLWVSWAYIREDIPTELLRPFFCLVGESFELQILVVKRIYG